MMATMCVSSRLKAIRNGTRACASLRTANPRVRTKIHRKSATLDKSYEKSATIERVEFGLYECGDKQFEFLDDNALPVKITCGAHVTDIGAEFNGRNAGVPA